MTFNWSLILVLFLILIVCFWQASAAGEGTGLILWFLAAMVTCIPTAFFVYRLYGLYRCEYRFDRETFTMRWGLRLVRMPLSDIEWIRSVQDLTKPLALPRFVTPGAIIGIQKHPDLGEVEFLASDRKGLLMVATANQVYVISPKDPFTFVQDFQRSIEIGSHSTTPAQSIYPSFVFSQALTSSTTRILWVIGILLNAGLLVWVSLMVPRLTSIPLGFITTGVPRISVPGIQLFLLPIISILFFVTSWLAGIYFSRRTGMQILAHFVWGFSIFTALMFLIATVFIITTPV